MFNFSTSCICFSIQKHISHLQGFRTVCISYSYIEGKYGLITSGNQTCALHSIGFLCFPWLLTVLNYREFNEKLQYPNKSVPNVQQIALIFGVFGRPLIAHMTGRQGSQQTVIVVTFRIRLKKSHVQLGRGSTVQIIRLNLPFYKQNYMWLSFRQCNCNAEKLSLHSCVCGFMDVIRKIFRINIPACL